MAGTPKEAVVSCLPLDKASGFSWKIPTKLIIQHSCVNVRPADVLPQKVLAFLPPSLPNYFEAGDSIWKPASMWKDGASLGPTPHSVLRGPTKAQWYTDKHGTFSTPTQTKALFSSSALLCLSCSHGSQSKTLKGGALPIYWSTFVIYHSSTSLKYQTKSIWFYSPKPQALHGNTPFIHARHDKACPCDNSLLTLLLQMVSVTLTDQSLFWEWLHHKDIREGLQGFFF